jgi:hypothetical protein
MVRRVALAALVFVLGTAPCLAQAPPPAAATPKWFKFSFLNRGRVEQWTGTLVPDTYYLNRLRLQADVLPTRWLRAVVQVQDARVAGFSAPVAPATAFNELDLRLAFVDVKHAPSSTAWRLGRQELQFGDGRLVAPSDWGNVTRTFDAIAMRWTRQQWTVTSFAAAVVAIDSRDLDERRRGEWLYGAYVTLAETTSKRVWEPYVFVKTNDTALDERGGPGDAASVTAGLRAVGTVTPRVDYNVEAAYQGGHASGDTHRAWAAHAGGGFTWTTAAWKPRAGADYDAASGDGARRDGMRGTFDPLFPSTHAKWGLADRVSWRNMAHFGATLTVTPRRATTLGGGWHRNWLRETADGYYNGSGVRVPALRPSTSRHLGDSLDAQVTLDITRHLNVNAGIGYFFVGPYLREALDQQDQWTQFVMWRVVF